MKRFSDLFSGKMRKIALFFIDAAFCFSINVLYVILQTVTGSFPEVNQYYWQNVLIILCVVMFVRFLFGAYLNVWRFADTRAYLNLVIADAISAVLSWGIARLCSVSMGLLYPVTVVSLSCLMSLGARFSYRVLYKWLKRRRYKGLTEKVRVAIIGAGQLGVYLARELSGNPKSHYQPMCFIDVDRSKIGGTISGLPVRSEDDASKIFSDLGIQEVIIAISKGEDVINDLYTRYSELGCRVKIYDLPIQEKNKSKASDNPRRVIREFSIEDLLFRKPMSFDTSEVFWFYAKMTVLVTGGGGSIGSELCRQIAKCRPKKLIIFDIYENNAYEIQQELIREYGDKLDLAVEIGSVRDRKRLDCVFRNYRPDVVFHAAAHKHVPLMEHSGAEAIKNNVVGTYNTADMAERYGVKKFVLISTDKAVNPTNIMGASKRLCEMVIQCRTDSKTVFSAVRFGNVLGSNGSVIPLFKRQIANGGPVTITDKRIIRYFMTIPEASQLVMHAGVLAEKGQLFVLDMGRPVRIYDLAVNMIKLMGYEPGRDIEIREIGLRPGEKLYEELLMKTEELDKTANSMIFVEKDTPLTREQVDEKLQILADAVDASRYDLGSDKIKAAIIKTVPTFVDPDLVNRNAAKSEEMKMAAAAK
ncbi:MAG: polysaccharide biosynthesis protein [Clostridia bacterium]|nr:polysaccharide biosynthesis protein [Clostridia bacterium]